MKFIHISDLHIGKRIHEFSMIEDQIYVLEQVTELVREEEADAVILAGDIYDKSVPSAEAVRVFDQFLSRLADLGTAVFIISGNHDSPERIAFGARLMQKQDIYVSPVYDGTLQCISWQDAYGIVRFYLLPFLKPSMVRHAMEMGNLAEGKADTYQEALQIAIAGMRADPKERNVLVAHQFVTGASCCESEDLQVGGIDAIGADLFDAFDYVALGHIHSPQSIGRESVRYCGTLLKYSFSEANQTKTVTLVEMKEKGNLVIRTKELHPLRDMRRLRGSYMELTDVRSYQGTNLEDYVQITLTDEEDIPDVLQKLRILYPNLMQLAYDNTRTHNNQELLLENLPQKSELEILEEFYALQNNQDMTEQQRRFSKQLLDACMESAGRDGR